MKKFFAKPHFVIMSFLIVVLIILVFMMMVEVADIQKYARVVNYTGILRGATQRLVKNELCGNHEDDEIERLDNILMGLRTGQNAYDLVFLNDSAYQNVLSELSTQWDSLKEMIRDFRADPAKRDDLIKQSEIHFTTADNAVNASEAYSVKLSNQLRGIELLILADILFILFGLAFQIVAKIKSNRKLSLMAYIDPNTGLPNRRRCDEILLTGAVLSDTQNTCCMMFDLNNLKLTNDLFGHDAGDALIYGFSSVLRMIAPQDMFIGRYGGDEFIGIHTNTTKDEMYRFLESLRKAIEKKNDPSSPDAVQISFACGYAFSSDHKGHSLSSLMKIADQNMYENKAEMKKAK